MDQNDLHSSPSKIGKTVLCEKVVTLEKLVEITGADFVKKEELWNIIGSKAGMPTAGQSTTVDASNNLMSESYILTKESVIAYYKQHDLVLLIDDFHYACSK